MIFLQDMIWIELVILVACFAVVLAWKILRGLMRLLRNRETRKALPGGIAGALRLQMPAASLVIAFLYLRSVAASGRKRQSAPQCPSPHYRCWLAAKRCF